MRAVISLANGNETQNCNKWGHATGCRCSRAAPRPEYTCPIKLTLTPPPTEQTSLLSTPPPLRHHQQSPAICFPVSRGPRSDCNVSTLQMQSDAIKHLVGGTSEGLPAPRAPTPPPPPSQAGTHFDPPVSSLSFELSSLCWPFDGKHLLARVIFFLSSFFSQFCGVSGVAEAEKAQ